MGSKASNHVTGAFSETEGVSLGAASFQLPQAPDLQDRLILPLGRILFASTPCVALPIRSNAYRNCGQGHLGSPFTVLIQSVLM
jgi:hypothetical protein